MLPVLFEMLLTKDLFHDHPSPLPTISSGDEVRKLDSIWNSKLEELCNDFEKLTLNDFPKKKTDDYKLINSLPSKERKKHFIELFMKDAIFIWKRKLHSVLEKTSHLFDEREKSSINSEQAFDDWLWAYGQKIRGNGKN